MDELGMRRESPSAKTEIRPAKLAHFVLRTSRFAEAIDEYRIARAGAPDSATIAVRLTAALAAAGRSAEARAEQARAEAQFPNDPGVVQMRRTLAAPPD